MSVSIPQCFALLILRLTLAFATRLNCVPDNKTALSFGTEVVINCTYAQPKTSWKCDQGGLEINRPKSQETFTNPLFNQNSRLREVEDTSIHSCSFKIVQLNASDDGLWRIKAAVNKQNSDLMDLEAVLKLDVFKPLSKVMLQREGKEMETIVQEQLSLADTKEIAVNCLALNTYPMPDFQWYENGVESHIATRPTEVDKSNYMSAWEGSINRETTFTNLTCLVSYGNSGLPSMSTSSLIEIQFSPYKFSPSEFFSLSTIAKSLIVMTYRANPTPDTQTITLKVGNDVLSESSFKHIQLDNFKVELSFEFQMEPKWNGKTGTLTIGSISKEITFYTIARAFLQKDQKLIGNKTLFELDKKHSKEIELDCVAIDNRPRPYFQWYINGLLVKEEKEPKKIQKYKNSYKSTWRSSLSRGDTDTKNLTCKVLYNNDIEDSDITTVVEAQFSPYNFRPKKFYSMTAGITKTISITFRANPMPKLDEITWRIGQEVLNVSNPMITINQTQIKKQQFQVTFSFLMKAEWEDKTGLLTIGQSKTEDITLYALSQEELLKRKKFQKVVTAVGVVVGLVLSVMIYIFVVRHRGSGLISTSSKIVYWCRHRFQPID